MSTSGAPGGRSDGNQRTALEPRVAIDHDEAEGRRFRAAPYASNGADLPAVGGRPGGPEQFLRPASAPGPRLPGAPPVFVIDVVPVPIPPRRAEVDWAPALPAVPPAAAVPPPAPTPPAPPRVDLADATTPAASAEAAAAIEPTAALWSLRLGLEPGHDVEPLARPVDPITAEPVAATPVVERYVIESFAPEVVWPEPFAPATAAVAEVVPTSAPPEPDEPAAAVDDAAPGDVESGDVEFGDVEFGNVESGDVAEAEPDAALATVVELSPGPFADDDLDAEPMLAAVVDLAEAFAIMPEPEPEPFLASVVELPSAFLGLGPAPDAAVDTDPDAVLASVFSLPVMPEPNDEADDGEQLGELQGLAALPAPDAVEGLDTAEALGALGAVEALEADTTGDAPAVATEEVEQAMSLSAVPAPGPDPAPPAAAATEVAGSAVPAAGRPIPRGRPGLRELASRGERLLAVLDELPVLIPGVRGGLVAGADGLPVVATLPEHEVPRVAAVTAMVVGLSQRTLDQVGLGCFEETVIGGDEGVLVVYDTGAGASLAVAVEPDVNLGLVHLEARAAARRLADVLTERREG